MTVYLETLHDRIVELHNTLLSIREKTDLSTKRVKQSSTTTNRLASMNISLLKAIPELSWPRYTGAELKQKANLTIEEVKDWNTTLSKERFTDITADENINRYRDAPDLMGGVSKTTIKELTKINTRATKLIDHLDDVIKNTAAFTDDKQSGEKLNNEISDKLGSDTASLSENRRTLRQHRAAFDSLLNILVLSTKATEQSIPSIREWSEAHRLLVLSAINIISNNYLGTLPEVRATTTRYMLSNHKTLSNLRDINTSLTDLYNTAKLLKYSPFPRSLLPRIVGLFEMNNISAEFTNIIFEEDKVKRNLTLGESDADSLATEYLGIVSNMRRYNDLNLPPHILEIIKPQKRIIDSTYIVDRFFGFAPKNIVWKSFDNTMTVAGVMYKDGTIGVPIEQIIQEFLSSLRGVTDLGISEDKERQFRVQWIRAKVQKDAASGTGGWQLTDPEDPDSGLWRYKYRSSELNQWRRDPPKGKTEDDEMHARIGSSPGGDLPGSVSYEYMKKPWAFAWDRETEQDYINRMLEGNFAENPKPPFDILVTIEAQQEQREGELNMLAPWGVAIAETSPWLVPVGFAVGIPEGIINAALLIPVYSGALTAQWIVGEERDPLDTPPSPMQVLIGSPFWMYDQAEGWIDIWYTP